MISRYRSAATAFAAFAIAAFTVAALASSQVEAPRVAGGRRVGAERRVADRRRVISETQLKSLFQRSANNPAYGKLWWLNGGGYANKKRRSLREKSHTPGAELVDAAD